MAQKEITYEESLETMNEDGLRAECVRLKEQLDKFQVQVLTEPVEVVNVSTYSSIDRIKECLNQIREHHTMYPSDADMTALMNIVESLISAVGHLDSKVNELSEAIDTDLQQPVRGHLFREK